jgi:hypothetical protein
MLIEHLTLSKLISMLSLSLEVHGVRYQGLNPMDFWNVRKHL